MKFKYEGYDKQGTVKRGLIDAPDTTQACQNLRADGLFVQKCVPEHERLDAVLPGGEEIEEPQDGVIEEVLPGAKSSKFIDPVAPACANSTTITETMTLKSPAEEFRPMDWKDALKAEFENIEKVCFYAKSVEKDFDDLPDLKKTITEAGKEMVKNAIYAATERARIS